MLKSYRSEQLGHLFDAVWDPFLLEGQPHLVVVEGHDGLVVVVVVVVVMVVVEVEVVTVDRAETMMST